VPLWTIAATEAVLLLAPFLATADAIESQKMWHIPT
jgi:hypothetical protein